MQVFLHARVIKDIDQEVEFQFPFNYFLIFNFAIGFGIKTNESQVQSAISSASISPGPQLWYMLLNAFVLIVKEF